MPSIEVIRPGHVVFDDELRAWHWTFHAKVDGHSGIIDYYNDAKVSERVAAVHAANILRSNPNTLEGVTSRRGGVVAVVAVRPSVQV